MGQDSSLHFGNVSEYGRTLTVVHQRPRGFDQKTTYYVILPCITILLIGISQNMSRNELLGGRVPKCLLSC